MMRQILMDAWRALLRNRTRSVLTMLGIVWGIMAVALLISYGGGFREVMVESFEAFGHDVVIGWPGQTSEQAGGQRAGKKIVLEQADVDRIKADAPLVKTVCRESVKWVQVTAGDRSVNTAVRGVCPEYGWMRNESPREGRWINSTDEVERRRVAFLGGRVYEQLFAGRPAVDQEIAVNGVRFKVIGVMARKLQLSNYFTSDDRSLYIPYAAAGDLWSTRFGSVLVFSPVAPRFEKQARAQVLAALAGRQNFSPTDKKALEMFGGEEFRPVIDGLTIGLQALLLFIGALTLGIGGVGVMNIMLVSVNERIREIGLRRALGATRFVIRLQFLAETLLIMLSGGAIGIVLSYLLALVLPTLPMLGPLFQDTTGKGDIHLNVSLTTVGLSTLVLVLVGLVSGMVPALRASKLDPVEALRYE